MDDGADRSGGAGGTRGAGGGLGGGGAGSGGDAGGVGGTAGAEDRVFRAAMLLEAVARDAERATDPDVPVFCAIAAGRLHAAQGHTSPALPRVADDPAAIAAAIGAALDELAGLPADRWAGEVAEASANARAAATAHELARADGGR